MKLHDKVGLTAEQVDPEFRADAARRAESILGRIDLIPLGQEELSVYSALTATAYYLMEDYESSQKYAQRVVPTARDYYYGNWRSKVRSGNYREFDPDPSWWHDKEIWMDVFRDALCWGSVLGDWEGLRKLSEYPDERRSMEKSNIDKKPAMRQLLLDIAKHLRGEKVAKVADRVGKLVGANWRGTRVLAEALDAIAAKVEAAANEAINGFLMLHHKRIQSSIRKEREWAQTGPGMSNVERAKVHERLFKAATAGDQAVVEELTRTLIDLNRQTKEPPSRSITDSVCLDATIMVNLARRDGLRITIDPKLEMYVIKL